tara:strand:+ start:278 stop:517 length:240 start_codon:yes stop_codon:yes gene_type:complete
MRYIILTFSVVLFSNLGIACKFFDKNLVDNANILMGKKSQFYDAYKQGICVLEEALKPLPEQQREVIANLIAKKYRLDD